jgi:hypothetical protein
MELYGGYPRFQYGGFWFGFMDPWPEYWADDWYDNDDVYVVYSEDGYYLYNRRHPRDRIAITVYVDWRFLADATRAGSVKQRDYDVAEIIGANVTETTIARKTALHQQGTSRS